MNAIHSSKRGLRTKATGVKERHFSNSFEEPLRKLRRIKLILSVSISMYGYEIVTNMLHYFHIGSLLVILEVFLRKFRDVGNLIP